MEAYGLFFHSFPFRVARLYIGSIRTYYCESLGIKDYFFRLFVVDFLMKMMYCRVSLICIYICLIIGNGSLLNMDFKIDSILASLS